MSISKDSRVVAVWCQEKVSLISLAKRELVHEFGGFKSVLGVFISPDSLFIVVVEKTNIKIYNTQDFKLQFDYSVFRGQQKNPFMTEAELQTPEISIGKIKFSFF